MKNNIQYDVVVVGAGPAGSILSYRLAKEGAKVLLLDRQKFPRYKACGGGITRRALDLFPFEIDGIIENRIHTAKMSYNNVCIFSQSFYEPVIAMVMREKLDQFLVEKAMSAGVEFQDNCAFQSLSGKPGHLTLKASGNRYLTRIAAGCDGVNSKVAGSLNLHVKSKRMTAVEGEIFPKHPQEHRIFNHQAHFDFGVVPNGYGWVFPKKGHLSAGIVTLGSSFSGWKQYFFNYLKLKKIGSCSEIKPLKGHQIPFRPDRKNILSNSKGLLVGDAAGFTDPLTGEGIFFALKQTQIAADVIMKSLESGFHVLDRYSALVKRTFETDLMFSGYMSQILYGHPGLTRRLMNSFGRIMAENELKVICSMQSYTDIARKFFNPVKLMKKFLQLNFYGSCDTLQAPYIWKT